MAESRSSITQEPLYLKGMACFQAGEWQEAIRCFELLLQHYPDSPKIQQLLEWANFKADLAQKTNVTPKQFVVPWAPWLFRGATVIVVAVLLFQGVALINRHVVPVVARVRVERQINRTLEEGKAFLEAGNLDQAELHFREVLASRPDDADALAGLATIDTQRALEAQYLKALSLEKQGEYQAALEIFNDLAVQAPGFRDVNERIQTISNLRQLDELYALGKIYTRVGLYAKAVDAYQQIQEISTYYKRDEIKNQLFSLYVLSGQELVNQTPPQPENIPQAIEYFKKALSIQPNNETAILEHRLASLYWEGKTLYDAGQWDAAAHRLQAVFTERPDYLGGVTTALLYDAYIQSGEQHRQQGDNHFAYEQFRKASMLPVEDTTLARGRMEALAPLLTPTPTPTATPTITPTPIPVPPTPTPTPRPLAAYHNRILFWSDHPEKPGLWVMDPDGSHRAYLGNTSQLRQEYMVLAEQAQFSPDGRYRVIVQERETAARRVPQVYIQPPPHPELGPLPPKELTPFTGMSYDPVWSPDGSRVAFVSQESGSDDIWIIYTDGTGARNLTPNKWEWDKHPSWSPDGRRIVFWSNRDGRKQIYIMDIDGRNVRNISQAEWDEYDPIWVH